MKIGSRKVGKGALRAVPTIYPDRYLVVGTLRFAYPTIRSMKRPRTEINRRSLPRAFPIPEFVDHVAAGDRVEFQRVHIMVRGDVVAQARIIGAQHVARLRRRDIFTPATR